VKWDGTRLVVGGGARFAGTTGDAPADAQHPPSGGYTLTEITPRAGTLYFLNVPTASGDRVFAIWVTPDQPIGPGQPLLIDYRESAAAPKAVASGPLPGLLDDINSPADFFKGGADVATTNLLLTVVVVLLLLAGGSVFNEALEETLADWRIGGVSVPGPISTPVHWVTSAGSSILRGWAALIPGRTWLDRALAPAAVLLGTGFIYSLLDPHFGWNQKTFTLFVSLVVSQGVLALGYEGGKAWLYRRNMHVPSAVRLFPACIGIAVVSVLISRAADFHPGIVVGFVAAAIILEKEEDVSAAERGKACARVAIIFLGISVAAWVAAIRCTTSTGIRQTSGRRCPTPSRSPSSWSAWKDCSSASYPSTSLMAGISGAGISSPGLGSSSPQPSSSRRSCSTPNSPTSISSPATAPSAG
jgi:hypothetical protein